MQSWQEAEAEYTEGAVRGLRSSAREAFGPWLQELRPWTQFGTLTLDTRRLVQERLWCSTMVHRPVPPDKAEWMVRRAMQQAGRSLRTRLDWVAGIEPHKSGDLHAHVLVDTQQEGDGRDDIVALWRSWYERGGFCLFEPPRSDLSVSEYIGKYLVKEGLVRLLFSPGLGLPALPRLRRFPGSLSPVPRKPSEPEHGDGHARLAQPLTAALNLRTRSEDA